MSLIVDYGGGAAPPTAAILYSDNPDLGSQPSQLDAVPRDHHLGYPASRERLEYSPRPADLQLDFGELPPVPPLQYSSSANAPDEDASFAGRSRDSYSPLDEDEGRRVAGKASRRRRRSPPSVARLDINDNSLHSAYAFVRSFLSASSASTVAIDNKIEQAMDLVKSHLMLAVREEVDVLKERIGELMERINHLEYENSVLKKYATPETLQQIQHSGSNP